MIPVKPLSVKFNDEDERAKVKALATLLGWTESQIVRDSVAHVLHLIHHPGSTDEPKLITRARLLLGHETIPVLGLHMKKLHTPQDGQVSEVLSAK